MFQSPKTWPNQLKCDKNSYRRDYVSFGVFWVNLHIFLEPQTCKKCDVFIVFFVCHLQPQFAPTKWTPNFVLGICMVGSTPQLVNQPFWTCQDNCFGASNTSPTFFAPLGAHMSQTLNSFALKPKKHFQNWLLHALSHISGNLSQLFTQFFTNPNNFCTLFTTDNFFEFFGFLNSTFLNTDLTNKTISKS